MGQPGTGPPFDKLASCSPFGATVHPVRAVDCALRTSRNGGAGQVIIKIKVVHLVVVVVVLVDVVRAASQVWRADGPLACDDSPHLFRYQINFD